MVRKIMQFLEEWKQSPHRKPLILQGARQVGKTYSLLAFGRAHYENVVYFNFETTIHNLSTPSVSFADSSLREGAGYCLPL